MLSLQTQSPREVVGEPLDEFGRGFPSDGFERSANQQRMIAQGNTLLGQAESLLNQIRTCPNSQPDGAVKALETVTTRLDQTVSGVLREPAQHQIGALTELKSIAMSGVRFIQSHVNDQLEPGHPVKVTIGQYADDLCEALEVRSQEGEDSVNSVSSDSSKASQGLAAASCLSAMSDLSQMTSSGHQHPPSLVETSRGESLSERSGASEMDSSFAKSDVSMNSAATTSSSDSQASQASEELVEQLRCFVQQVSPFFNGQGDKMTSALAKRATGLHGLLFTGVSPEQLTIKKIAARAAVEFVTHDFLSRTNLQGYQRQRVSASANRLVSAIDGLLEQPSVQLAQQPPRKTAKVNRGPLAWLPGLNPQGKQAKA